MQASFWRWGPTIAMGRSVASCRSQIDFVQAITARLGLIQSDERERVSCFTMQTQLVWAVVSCTLELNYCRHGSSQSTRSKDDGGRKLPVVYACNASTTLSVVVTRGS